MAFELEYYHPRVLAGIESWPVDLLADYARLAALLMWHGPDLRLPHSRAHRHWPRVLLFYCWQAGGGGACVCEEDAADAGP